MCDGNFYIENPFRANAPNSDQKAEIAADWGFLLPYEGMFSWQYISQI